MTSSGFKIMWVKEPIRRKINQIKAERNFKTISETLDHLTKDFNQANENKTKIKKKENLFPTF